MIETPYLYGILEGVRDNKNTLQSKIAKNRMSVRLRLFETALVLYLPKSLSIWYIRLIEIDGWWFKFAKHFYNIFKKRANQFPFSLLALWFSGVSFSPIICYSIGTEFFAKQIDENIEAKFWIGQNIPGIKIERRISAFRV